MKLPKDWFPVIDSKLQVRYLKHASGWLLEPIGSRVYVLFMHGGPYLPQQCFGSIVCGSDNIKKLVGFAWFMDACVLAYKQRTWLLYRAYGKRISGTIMSPGEHMLRRLYCDFMRERRQYGA